MLIEDIRECDGCGATITHLIVAGSMPWRNDPDYDVCQSCVDERDGDGTCMSDSCSQGNCDGCSDIEGNCCDCSCHC